MRLEIEETDVSVLVHPRNSPGHRQAEEELLQSGVSLPLPHRTMWCFTERRPSSLAYVLLDGRQGRPTGLFCADLWRSRMIKGYRIARVEQFGHLEDERLVRSALEGLVESLGRIPYVLRLHVEVHSLVPAQREQIETTLEARGFRQEDDPRNYEDTGLVDLTPSLDEVFAGFHKTCRRNVRAVDKNPTELRPVVDPSFAPRLEALLRESYARTGGAPHSWDWRAVIAGSAEHPTLSRVAGLFRTDGAGSRADSLIAFDWGIHHGSHAQVVAGGATRHSGLRMPMAYGTCWDLIRWAREHGARVFDLGGITQATETGHDPMESISDFKRYFNPTVLRVGSEYSLDVSRTLGPLSRLLGRTANMFRAS